MGCGYVLDGSSCFLHLIVTFLWLLDVAVLPRRIWSSCVSSFFKGSSFTKKIDALVYLSKGPELSTGMKRKMIKAVHLGLLSVCLFLMFFQ